MTTDQRARLMVDAPITETSLALLTPELKQKIALELRAVFQSNLITNGVALRYESNASPAKMHVHNGQNGACMDCRSACLDELGSY